MVSGKVSVCPAWLRWSAWPCPASPSSLCRFPAGWCDRPVAVDVLNLAASVPVGRWYPGRCPFALPGCGGVRGRAVCPSSVSSAAQAETLQSGQCQRQGYAGGTQPARFIAGLRCECVKYPHNLGRMIARLPEGAADRIRGGKTAIVFLQSAASRQSWEHYHKTRNNRVCPLVDCLPGWSRCPGPAWMIAVAGLCSSAKPGIFPV